uniref:type IX secretion system membrane protein PorP/SprF n=1 Tax=Flavobacterium sp. TaxID=239 RepID=UPI00404A7A54
MKNKIIYIILASASIFSAQAQQEAHFTQFADNQLFVNPAYAGSNEILNATVLHRQQWVGFTGAPQTSTFSMHSPLSYESVGLGITMVRYRQRWHR